MPVSQRRPFDATLPVHLQLVPIRSIRSMSSFDLVSMLRAFNRHGFAILACEDLAHSRDDLLALKRHFGCAAPHPRADADGIVPINAFARMQGFLDSTSEEHLLHTDGAFSDTPEAILTLQCVVPTAQGGVSRLASAQAAYTHLAEVFPDRIHELSRPDALTVRRGAQSSTQPVFLRRGGGRLGIRFRMPDGAAEVTPHPAARELFDELCRFLTSPANVLELKLETGQVLVADNTAVVHGRTSYPPSEPRDMRRLNFGANGPLCELMTLGFVAKDPSHAIAGSFGASASA